jgi:hypothetical protein
MSTAITRPTTLAFDLDPGAPASIVECCDVALERGDPFAEVGSLQPSLPALEG